MSHLRATFKLAALCLMTCVIYVILVAGLAVALPFKRARARWRGLMLRQWARATALLLRIKVASSGVAPRTPFFLVSNHLSYVDVVVLASQLDCAFIAKREVASWPLIGMLCRGVGTIFVDRGNRRSILKVNTGVERAFGDERGVVLFAEGTSTCGAEVLPFKPGLLEPAVRASFAVSYAAISYRTCEGQVPAHLAVCWWGDMTFAGHLYGLLRLSGIRATLAFGDEAIFDSDRKQLARRLRAGVSREFKPVITPEGQWNAAPL
jgi:1-acyl-sn-glycerol-3-phosphate acyltransferase